MGECLSLTREVPKEIDGKVHPIDDN